VRRDAHFPLFDGLRAIAALSVLTLHGTYQVAVAQPELDPWWFRFGVHLDAGVAVFFAISGFLLYRPFLRATLAGEGVDVREYAIRRALRIVPAYWVALAVITVWFDLEEVQSAGRALQFALFAQVYDPDTALRGLGQAWTLDVEAVFYVVLPLFALGLARARTLRGAALGVLALIAASVAYKLVVLATVADASAQDGLPWLYSLPAHLDHLGLGMLLAVASLAGPRRLHAGWCWAGALVAWGLCGLVADTGSRHDPPVTDLQYLVRHALYGVSVVLLVAPAVFGDGGWPRRVLAWRPLVWVGTVSYSLYLWHYAVIAQGLDWLGRAPEGLEWLAWYAGALAAALAVAAASYYAVERPFMRLRRVRRSSALDAAQAHAAP
jgi:peptidoglycan/LPS O-acetylase OafA/YrhL